MHLRTPLSVVLCLTFLAAVTVQMSAAEVSDPTNVPDPFGLGERLALLDYLHEHAVNPPEQSTLAELRQLYAQSTGATAVAKERADIDVLRHYLAHDLAVHYGVANAETMTVSEIIHLHEHHLAEERRLSHAQDTDAPTAAAEVRTDADIRADHERRVKLDHEEATAETTRRDQRRREDVAAAHDAAVLAQEDERIRLEKEKAEADRLAEEKRLRIEAEKAETERLKVVLGRPDTVIIVNP